MGSTHRSLRLTIHSAWQNSPISCWSCALQLLLEPPKRWSCGSCSMAIRISVSNFRVAHAVAISITRSSNPSRQRAGQQQRRQQHGLRGSQSPSSTCAFCWKALIAACPATRALDPTGPTFVKRVCISPRTGGRCWGNCLAAGSGTTSQPFAFSLSLSWSVLKHERYELRVHGRHCRQNTGQSTTEVRT